jgi:SAM-dependent methyltransferase
MAEQEIEYTRYYRHWHDSSDEHYAAMVKGWAKHFETLIDAPRDAKIIDIGCGTGFAIGGLLKLGFKNAIGFDSDKGQVAEAQKRNLPVTLVSVADTLTFFKANEQTADIATAFDVLEHIAVDQQLSFLRGVKTLLKPGGLFICQVPNANSIVSSRFRWGDWTHHASFTEHSIDFVLHNAGFEDIEVLEFPDQRPPLSRRKDTLRWMLRRMFRGVRRIQFAVEIDPMTAKSMPLSPNLIARCRS